MTPLDQSDSYTAEDLDRERRAVTALWLDLMGGYLTREGLESGEDTIGKLMETKFICGLHLELKRRALEHREVVERFR